MILTLEEIMPYKHLLRTDDQTWNERIRFLLVHMSCGARVTTYEGRVNEGLSFDFFLLFSLAAM